MDKEPKKPKGCAEYHNDMNHAIRCFFASRKTAGLDSRLRVPSAAPLKLQRCRSAMRSAHLTFLPLGQGLKRYPVSPQASDDVSQADEAKPIFMHVSTHGQKQKLSPSGAPGVLHSRGLFEPPSET